MLYILLFCIITFVVIFAIIKYKQVIDLLYEIYYHNYSEYILPDDISEKLHQFFR